jgi:hypothetical protein
MRDIGANLECADNALQRTNAEILSLAHSQLYCGYCEFSIAKESNDIAIDPYCFDMTVELLKQLCLRQK